MLPVQVLEQAEQAVRECDLLLVVGTSGVVYPAAGLARQTSAKVVVVNPHATELDDAAHTIVRGTAAQVLPVALAG